MPSEVESTPSSVDSIVRLGVRGLHGRLDYDLDLAQDRGTAIAPGLASVNDSRLSLLYGNNGAGKTSVLRLLFHALSWANNRGHRTQLLGIRFREFSVETEAGSAIRYHRTQDRLTGPYTISTSIDGMTASWDFVPDAGDEVTDQEESVLAALRALAVNPAFLTDSRAFHSDLLKDEEDDVYWGRRRIQVEDIISQRRDADLTSALRRAEERLSRLVFTGAQQGTQRVDNVYLNVTQAIVNPVSPPGAARHSPISTLRRQIRRTGARARVFNDYGLIPEFPQDKLLALLQSPPSDAGSLLGQVLIPYLDGVDERMEALEPGLRAIAQFVDAVNEFFEGKTVSVKGARRVQILDQVNGDALAPEQLSSGEKQILLLLANLTAMQDTTRLFIVDEPELSLNPAWQRKLMPALLAVTEDSNLQIVAATHSIEIMARYRSRMRALG